MHDSATWSRHLEPEYAGTLDNLVSGMTDRANAHRLGVSERTVQRRIRELMDWSGSGNRMQLGRHAALAGLAGASSPVDAADLTESYMFGDRPPRCGRYPDADARHLLRLLLVDAAADRLLGLSPRSVERRVHELMTLAGARSRAQLGWRATWRGWI
ncbi:hypothetical protein [Catenulispora subtropica]|uniref:Uncharacterized protein n=1 Tax=Catenulispora subtropica TaxID=450798 RepID=A0ABP5E8I6_9ACTN